MKPVHPIDLLACVNTIRPVCAVEGAETIAEWISGGCVPTRRLIAQLREWAELFADLEGID